MDDKYPPEAQNEEPKRLGWLNKLVSFSLLSVTALVTPVQAAPPAKPVPRPAPAKSAPRVVTFDISGPQIKVIRDSAAPKKPVPVPTAVKDDPLPRHVEKAKSTPVTSPAKAEAPAPSMKGEKNVMVTTRVNANNKQDAIPGGSLTLNVSDHFYKAELSRKSKNNAGFNKNFYAGMEALLNVVEGVESSSYADNNLYTTVGKGFNMQNPSKSDDSTSRRIWAKVFGDKGPNFDACKAGKHELSLEEIQRLYVGTLQDSEDYLRKKFNQSVDTRKDDYAQKHPGKKLLRYHELPANQRGALLSIHYQSPSIATRLYVKLSEGDIDKATNILLTKTLAKKYASRRDIEHGLMAAKTTTVGPAQLAANVKAEIDKLKWDKKTVIHAYNATNEQKAAVRTALAPKNKNANYAVKAHGPDGKADTHVSRIAIRKSDKGNSRTS